jgi:hypothetical protein
MSLLDLYSERNILNSIGLFFAERLLEFDYLIYWHKLDALQTPEGLYTQYHTNSATYLADGTFQSRIASSKGIVTITEGETGFPRFATRPTAAGEVSTADRVQVPCFAVEVGPDVPGLPYEHGSKLRWRVRALSIDGRARTREELTLFSDKLTQWFDEDAQLPVEDHDNLSGEVSDTVRVTRRLVTKDVVEDLGEQDRFQLELNARLEFVA